MKKRLEEKGLKGNYAGEGLTKGGIIIIHPSKGVIYKHEEETGSVLPFDEINQALLSIKKE